MIGTPILQRVGTIVGGSGTCRLGHCKSSDWMADENIRRLTYIVGWNVDVEPWYGRRTDEV